MIRKELKEARDPLEKKGGYFGRGLAYDPEEEEENEKAIKDMEKQKIMDTDEDLAIERIINAIEQYDYKFGDQGGDLDPEEESIEELKNFITPEGALDKFKDDQKIIEMWRKAYDQWLDM